MFTVALAVMFNSDGNVEAALTVNGPVCSPIPADVLGSEFVTLYAGGAVPAAVGAGPLENVMGTASPDPVAKKIKFTDSPKDELVDRNN